MAKRKGSKSSKRKYRANGIFKKHTRKSIPKWRRKPVHLLTSALEIGGLAYGAYEAYHGNYTNAALGAAAAVAGYGGKSLAKSHRIGKVHKVTNTMGVKIL